MRPALAAFLAATIACSATDPSSGRVIGVVLPGLPEAPVIVGPDTVRAGQVFGAVVNTFGSSGCTTPAGVTLRQEPATATIIPYDLVSSEADSACTRDMAPRPHPVDLSFTRPGAAQILVRGVHVGGTVPGRSLVTVTKDLWVLP